MTDIFARAEEGDEVDGRTGRVGESDMESDALQELWWNGEQRRGRKEHGRWRGDGEGEEGEGVGGGPRYIWK